MKTSKAPRSYEDSRSLVIRELRHAAADRGRNRGTGQAVADFPVFNGTEIICAGPAGGHMLLKVVEDTPELRADRQLIDFEFVAGWDDGYALGMVLDHATGRPRAFAPAIERMIHPWEPQVDPA